MIRTISMKQLEAYLDSSSEFTLLDVRDREEFLEGHLEGAVNIPLGELEERSSEVPKTMPVLVYCGHGSRSLLAAGILAAQGFLVFSASGGLAYYRGRHYVAGNGRRQAEW